MTREEIDKYAITLLENHNNILFQWATGCGKTKQAITGISMLDRDKHNNVLIVVAERAHIKNWIEEFEKWGFKSLLTDVNFNIEIICYDSLHHYEYTHYDMIIFDEAHHIFTEIRTNILKTITASKYILLSATMEESIINDISDIIGKITVTKITLQEAIDWKLIPEPKIILCPMKLDNSILNQEIEITRGIEEKMVTIKCGVREKWKYLKDKKRFPNIRLIIPATQLQKYNDIDTNLMFYKRLYMAKKSESIKSKWLYYGLQRKNYLGTLKDNAAKSIIQNFGQSRYICFCTNIEQAEKLGGSHAIHSKKKESFKIIDDFNDKKINSLYVVGMLQEGQNLNCIEKGLIIQLDGKLRPFIQKSGRVLRAENPEIFIIYFEGTQDEVYLNNALEGLSPDYITYYEDYNR